MEKQETVKLIEEVLQKHGLIEKTEKTEELKEAGVDVMASILDEIRGIFIDESHILNFSATFKTWRILVGSELPKTKALLQPCKMSDLKPGDFYAYEYSDGTDYGLVVELEFGGFIAEELGREAYPYRRTAPWEYDEAYNTDKFYKLIPKG